MNAEIKKLLCLRIKNFRESTKLSQEKFCEKAEIDVRTMSNIENCRSFPSFETVCSIINAYKLEPNNYKDMKFDYDQKKLGKRIKELRISKSLSQDELCDKILDFDSHYLSKIETGKYSTSATRLIKIMNALEVTPDTFFDCEHLASENELDEMVAQEYKKLPLNKKRVVYRQIQILNEYEN